MSWLTVWAATVLGALLGHPAGPAQWQLVLSALDSIRSTAYTTGNAELLAKVYTADSEVLRRDRAVMVSYTARGFSIEQMDMRIHEVRAVERSPKRVQLQVVDQLGQVTVQSGGDHVFALPADRPTRRLVTLRFTSGGWQISAVRPR